MEMLRFTKEDGFSVMPWPVEASWRDMEDESVWRERIGYVDLRWEEGEEDLTNARCYSLRPVDGMVTLPKYLVTLWDVSYGESIFVEDLPAMLTLRIQLSQLCAASSIVYYSEEIAGVARKAFRATHGHEHYAVCRRCDPIGAESEERRRTERIAAKAKEKSGAR